MQNFIYSLIQIIHNFGAVTLVGAAAAALWLVRDNAAIRRKLAWLVAVVWAVQAVSGASFGAITFFFDGHLPDIHGIAVDALLVKIICAIFGFVVAVAYVRHGDEWMAGKRNFVWRILFALGATALCSAAFLRWFS